MLQDNFGRKIDYLRISVTDRCNLRCVYCMPESGIVTKPHDAILSFEQIERIVKIAVGLGIKKIRITGGEPLVRKDLVLLIEKLKSITGLKEVCLTTNGIYLKEYIGPLKQAGLDRINISLDSLNEEKFKKITRGGDLKDVLAGIESALSVGFEPLKINIVLLKGLNDDEIPDFANLARLKPLHIRFIEYMPTFSSSFGSNSFFSRLDVKKALSAFGGVKNFLGTIGYISPVSMPFCSACNKLRLTSDGRLRSCLHSSRAIDLKAAIEKGISDEEVAGLIKQAVYAKPRSHNLSTEQAGFCCESFSMCQIGG